MMSRCLGPSVAIGLFCASLACSTSIVPADNNDTETASEGGSGTELGDSEGEGTAADETESGASDTETGDTETEGSQSGETGVDDPCMTPCGHGECDLETGECICDVGYHGETCDELFSDCQEILNEFPESPDGLYMVEPEGSALFEVWCDQTTDGGGWMAVFKNHGGAQGGEISNLALLEGDPMGFEGSIAPHTEDLRSGVNHAAWQHYKGRTDHEWLKIGTLWDANGIRVFEQSLRVVLGQVTWDWLLALPVADACVEMEWPVSVIANGDTYLGQTNQARATLSSYGFGLGLATVDVPCQQGPSNVIDGEDLPRLDNNPGSHAIMLLFSYVHESANRDASRCQFGCWGEDSFGGYYDGFTWFVRPG